MTKKQVETIEKALTYLCDENDPQGWEKGVDMLQKLVRTYHNKSNAQLEAIEKSNRRYLDRKIERFSKGSEGGLLKMLLSDETPIPLPEITPENLEETFRTLASIFWDAEYTQPDFSYIQRDIRRNLPAELTPLHYSPQGIPVFNSEEKIAAYREFHAEYKEEQA